MFREHRAGVAIKILVAEHDAAWRHVICQSLTRQGFEVCTATDGASAWNILEDRNAPKLVVIDWMTPVVRGDEICRRIRARMDLYYTYVILLTARSYRVDVLAALSSGADDCMTKPFNSEELAARVGTGRRTVELEERLSKISGQWRTLLDNAPFGVVAVDKQGRIMRASKVFSGLLGYSDVRHLLRADIATVLHISDGQATGLMEQIRLQDPFDNVEVTCRVRGGMYRLSLWGRPLHDNIESA